MGEGKRGTESKDGSICVKNGEIIVKNPINKGEYAIICPPSKGSLFINGKKVNSPSSVKQEDEIEFKEENILAKREISFTYNKDKTEGYISINYLKAINYPLKDLEESKYLTLDVDEKEGEYPPIVTKREIEEELSKVGITFGVDNEALELITKNRNTEEVLIAKGIKAKPPIEDKIRLFFENEKKSYDSESQDQIDYRNFNTITSVKANELLAEIIKGENGVDGKNIFSKTILGKAKKKIAYFTGYGARLKDNLVYSTIDGKPKFDRNTFLVEPIYILNKDVTIATGNIKFPSNVEINGKVNEGMKVISGGSVLVRGGAFSAEIEAKSSSNVLGNIVDSTIKVGGTNLVKANRIKYLKILEDHLKVLISNTKYIKVNHLVKKGVTDGIIIKSLIETKLKDINKNLVKIISVSMQDNCCNSEVVTLIKGKLLGLGPSRIKDVSELDEIADKVKEELEELERDAIVFSDLTIEYAQESTVNVLGNIHIIGKGLFTSTLDASDSIVFDYENSVCRGGYLKASKLIKASTIGSESGVITSLEVDKLGEIYANIAYHNTTFIIGNKKYILDKPSKNIHIYIDKDGSLAVDKLLL
ncbi:MAG: flagellar assembly protein A [Clostridium sp.]|uniref:DUF342 domain-containing protein n=1 Tax=Clostridium sp. TaxID=1506 RepID=UPI0029064916|nr:flagellar assembly protein A [Clostridium sp.]MDU5109493.1 flagellar assembly protein A [Clostridium sp.]